MEIKKPTISVLLTTVCTLKCKHCQIKIPYMKAEHFDKKTILTSINELFRIVDFVDDLAIMGGELFLHPDIDEIIIYISKYNEKYKRLVFVTNGTVVPKQSTVDTIKLISKNYIIRIDNYGELSAKVDQLKALFEENRIIYEIRPYTGKENYGLNGGGWVDVVGDFNFKNYSEVELTAVYETCHNKETCVFLWDGKLYSCGMHAAACALGKVDDRPNIDSVDLMDNTEINTKKEIVSKFGTIPPNACKYCNGFDVQNSPRIKPALQI